MPSLTMALSSCQHQCGLGHTHLLLCSDTPRHVCLPNFEVTGARLAEYLEQAREEENPATVRCVLHNQEEQAAACHCSACHNQVQQPAAAEIYFSQLLKPSCSYSVGSGMQIPVVLLFLGLLTVPSRSQNSATGQVSRRQQQRMRAILGAGNLILESLTKGLNATRLSY